MGTGSYPPYLNEYEKKESVVICNLNDLNVRGGIKKDIF